MKNNNFNIVKLIEEKPIANLSSNSQNNLINKITEKFTDKQQTTKEERIFNSLQ
jgi:hypothetical protein